MQRYFIKKKDFSLEDTDIRHIKKVMRMNINDLIEVVYNNKLYICKITGLEPFNIKSRKRRNRKPKTSNISLTVAVSLVKEQKMDLILQKVNRIRSISNNTCQYRKKYSKIR
ncbi:MAG: 16S rRNA (uracil(1498)-N(3))-methyltransferase [Bacilli bacterium]|nr:MAG: 16S rRNA (uracil(1498)-N(3))-methyltransferase [Bacilli bacterium]